MSDPNGKLQLLHERLTMRKPRYTKTEKAFMDAMHQIVFQKGIKTLAESKTYHQLPEEVQRAYIRLLLTKTR
jgi:hypothetical protein